MVVDARSSDASRLDSTAQDTKSAPTRAKSDIANHVATIVVWTLLVVHRLRPDMALVSEAMFKSAATSVRGRGAQTNFAIPPSWGHAMDGSCATGATGSANRRLPFTSAWRCNIASSSSPGLHAPRGCATWPAAADEHAATAPVAAVGLCASKRTATSKWVKTTCKRTAPPSVSRAACKPMRSTPALKLCHISEPRPGIDPV
mmetsp:Transcript_11569/g.30945  ORF Transcript_11569/g.30945 Transcript_11569/m.30945 type:complete len:202 (+) Transcript_11569:716-1321(+)